ncbi:MAG: type IV secretion system DNA-binding domain-containing protein [Nocardiopsaceae bacterium]|nr:type IV secretion system DNA-binding domain-containing protein [Nocardiopsaceae bacterium]
MAHARTSVTVVEGETVYGEPPQGWAIFDETVLARHLLFLGAVGSGKTTGIKHVVRGLRERARAEDTFVFFDTKGDYLRAFCRDSDAVLGPGARRDWNVFAELTEADDAARADQAHEIASTLFGDDAATSGQNAFFAYAARDLFGAVLLAMSRDRVPYSNKELRQRLEEPAGEIRSLLTVHDDLAGTADRYLSGTDATVKSVLAFLQQKVEAIFSGRFRAAGDFSVREFIRAKGGRALFVEYDLAIGARLLPVYRVLIDMAIREALELGRAALTEERRMGRVYFVLDEFALLPLLPHLADGVNFGRELGLRFIAGSQDIHQVLHSYGPDVGQSIVSGFGTIAAFRLLDAASRDVVRQRFGTNRKRITIPRTVQSDRDQHEIVTGNVIEDWDLSRLRTGTCLIAPHEGPPFWSTFPRPDR